MRIYYIDDEVKIQIGSCSNKNNLKEVIDKYFKRNNINNDYSLEKTSPNKITIDFGDQLRFLSIEGKELNIDNLIREVSDGQIKD